MNDNFDSFLPEQPQAIRREDTMDTRKHILQKVIKETWHETKKYKRKSKEMKYLSLYRSEQIRYRKLYAKYMYLHSRRYKRTILNERTEDHLCISEPPSEIRDPTFNETCTFSEKDKVEWLYNYLISPSAFRNCQFRLKKKPSESTVRTWKMRYLANDILPDKSDLQNIKKLPSIISKWSNCYHQKSDKSPLKGVLMVDAVAAKSYISYRKNKWEGLLPDIEPEFDPIIMNNHIEFEKFIDQLKNQKLAVTHLFVFYFAPLSVDRPFPLFLYQSNKGNADDKTDYFLLKIGEELEKQNFCVVAKAFDADPSYLKYARRSFLDIRKVILDYKFDFIRHIPSANVFISDPAHLLKRFRRYTAYPLRTIVNSPEEVIRDELSEILDLKYERIWDVSPKSKLDDFYPSILFTHENALKVIQSKKWKYLFSFLPPCCLNICIRCHRIDRFQRSRILIFGLFIMLIHFETIIQKNECTKDQKRNVFPLALIIQYIVTIAAILLIFTTVKEDFGLDRVGSLILEHFFGKLRQICPDQYLNTMLIKLQDLILLEWIRPDDIFINVPKRNFDTARAGNGAVNFEKIEIEQIYCDAKFVCDQVNQINLQLSNSPNSEREILNEIIKLFSFPDGSYLYRIKPSTASQKITAHSNSIMERFKSNTTNSGNSNRLLIKLKTGGNENYRNAIEKQYGNIFNNQTIDNKQFSEILRLKVIDTMEEEEDLDQSGQWNSDKNAEEEEDESSGIECEEDFSDDEVFNLAVRESLETHHDIIVDTSNNYLEVQNLGISRPKGYPICYLITCLQLFFNNEIFNHIIDNYPCNKQAIFIPLYKQIRDSITREIMPFFDELKKADHKYTLLNQEDVIETFQSLLSYFYSEMGPKEQKYLDMLFNIHVKTRIKCPFCSENIQNFDSMNIIVLPIKYSTLSENLDDNMNGQVIEKKLCSCGGQIMDQKISSEFDFNTLPFYLIFQIARFRVINRKISVNDIYKNNKIIGYPATLDQNEFNITKGSVKYVLHQIIYHNGTYRTGHYFTDVVTSEAIIRYNDADVRVLTEVLNFYNPKAYVIIYKRI